MSKNNKGPEVVSTGSRFKVDPKERREVNKTIANFAELKSKYEHAHSLLLSSMDTYDAYQDELDQVRNKKHQYEAELSTIQEEIDADYRPEGAQPRERINRRDMKIDSLNRIEEQLDLCQRKVDSALSEIHKYQHEEQEASLALSSQAPNFQDASDRKAVISLIDNNK